MTRQLCACAALDWSQVPTPQPEHHPDCTEETIHTLKFKWVDPVIRDVEHLRVMMEKRVGAAGPNGFTTTSPTGEPYVTFAIGGVVDEGEYYPLVACSENKALIYFWMFFCLYVDKLPFGDLRRRPVLYWRRCPEIRLCGDYFTIMARLLVSDKPWI